MASLLNILNLHHDIKRIILRMEENSMQEIRRISPSWNHTVLEHLSDRRNKLPLERLYLQSGVLSWDYSAYGAQDEEMQRNNTEALKLLHMYAIIPDRSKARFGLGKWMKTHQNFQGATEVTCAPQKIMMDDNDGMNLLAPESILSLVVIIAGVCLASSCLLGNHCICPLAIVISLAYFALHRHANAKANDVYARRLARLARFFSSFLRIQLVVFDSFTDLTILDKVTSALGETRIDKIEVRVSVCNQEVMNRIVKLVRKHNIERISLLASNCDQGRIQEFFTNLSSLGATVNIYEHAENNTQFYEEVLNYFHRPAEFWDKMAADLKKEKITLKLNTVKDDNFVKLQCASYARSHLACMPSNLKKCHDDHERPRGYYRMK